MIGAHCLVSAVPGSRCRAHSARTAIQNLVIPICLSIALPLWSPSAHAGSGVRNDMVRLARTADVVALGVCLGSQSAWNSQRRVIETTIRFRPIRAFKGEATAPLTIKVLGGRVGAEGMAASQSTTLAVDEEAVLFLRRSQFGAYYIVADGPRGKLTVQRDPHTGRRLIRGTLSLEDFERLVTSGEQ